MMSANVQIGTDMQISQQRDSPCKKVSLGQITYISQNRMISKHFCNLSQGRSRCYRCTGQAQEGADREVLFKHGGHSAFMLVFY